MGTCGSEFRCSVTRSVTYNTIEGYLKDMHLLWSYSKNNENVIRLNTMMRGIIPLSILYYLDIIYTCSSVHELF